MSLRRRIITLFRIANNGFHNLFRNTWLTTAAVAVMMVTLTIVISATVASFALQEVIEVASRDLTVSIFLQDSAPSKLKDQLKTELEAKDYIDHVHFKSKAEALVDFQTDNADNQYLLDSLAIANTNPLPASYEVFMKDINNYQEVLGVANSATYVDVVRETNDKQAKKSQNTFNRFIGLQENINKVGIALGIVFGLISVLVIFNTIRMAIFTRSNEIEIMKLIGATPGYIRGPYLFEASMYGFVAAIISLSIVYGATVPYAKRFVEPYLSKGDVVFEGLFPQGVVSYFTDNWLKVFGAMILGGVMIGSISASVAIKKYLRLKKW